MKTVNKGFTREEIAKMILESNDMDIKDKIGDLKKLGFDITQIVKILFFSKSTDF